VIHRFINGGIELIAADIFALSASVLAVRSRQSNTVIALMPEHLCYRRKS
jgi:hypothetical protein